MIIKVKASSLRLAQQDYKPGYYYELIQLTEDNADSWAKEGQWDNAEDLFRETGLNYEDLPLWTYGAASKNFSAAQLSKAEKVTISMMQIVGGRAYFDEFPAVQVDGKYYVDSDQLG